MSDGKRGSKGVVRAALGMMSGLAFWRGSTTRESGGSVMEPRGAAPPISGVFGVGGVPLWSDALPDQVEPLAYEIMRRADCVRQPMDKIGNELGARRIRVVCDDSAEFGAVVQERVIDRVVGVTDAVKWLAWALIEGMRGVNVVAQVLDGWIVPDLRGGGRKKVRAGGVLQWDGADGVWTFPPAAGARYTANPDMTQIVGMQGVEKHPRHAFMIWRPGGGSSPEGDSELAFSMLPLARGSVFLQRCTELYLERFGIPTMAYKQAMPDGITPAAAAIYRQQARDTMDKLQRMQSNGGQRVVIQDVKDALEMLAAPAGAHQLLLDLRREYRSEAHQAILANATTSAPVAVGKDQRGDSRMGQEEQAIAVDTVARSMGEGPLADLQRFIEFYNRGRLIEAARAAGLDRVPRWRLELQAVSEDEPPTFADLHMALSAGQPVLAADYYGALRVDVPPGAPDVLTAVPVSPFAAPPGLPAPVARASSPRSPFARAVASRRRMVRAAKDPVAKPLANLAGELRVNLGPTMQDAYRQAAEQIAAGQAAALSKAAEEALAQARFLSGMAGGVQESVTLGLLDQVDVPEIEAVIRVSYDLPMQEAVDAFAKQAPRLADTARRVAEKVNKTMPALVDETTATLQEQITARLQTHLEVGGDRREFVKWLEGEAGGAENLGKGYADMVYQTNINSAYNAGRLAQADSYNDLAEAEGLPRVVGYEYHTVGDARVRPEHAALDGAIIPNTPEGRKLLPPSDYNCRCTYSPILEDDPEAAQVISDAQARALLPNVSPGFRQEPGAPLPI